MVGRKWEKKNHRKRKEIKRKGWGEAEKEPRRKYRDVASVVECLPHKHETPYLSHNRREKKWGGKLGGSRRRKRRGKKRRKK